MLLLVQQLGSLGRPELQLAFKRYRVSAREFWLAGQASKHAGQSGDGNVLTLPGQPSMPPRAPTLSRFHPPPSRAQTQTAS